MKDFLLYTLARIAVFVSSVVLVGAAWRLFTDDIPVLGVLVVGAIVSMVISAYTLAGLRERMALRLHDRASRMSSRFEEMRAKEDQD